MNKKQQVYVVVSKETEKRTWMLINNWGIYPMFTKKKFALEFMRERYDHEYLKVIKCNLYEK